MSINDMSVVYILLFNLLNLFMLPSNGYMVPMMKSPISPFNEWHCIDFVKNIDKTKPFSYNVGDLPLVSWFNTKNNSVLSTLNICSHMGSKLDHGKVIDGCLTCPYHGLIHDEEKTFGKTLIFQDKLWWSYEPKYQLPPAIPFYKSKKFETSHMTIDIDANIIDCAFNTMDMNHPAYVHNNILGFGSNIPPTDVKTLKYHKKNKVGLSFTYKSNSNLVHLKNELKLSKNFHIYEYPYSTWSRVSLPNNQHLIINVNMLPLSQDKTRWFITMKYNYWNKMHFEKSLMYFAANCILYQDKYQLARQAEVSELKNMVMFQHTFEHEEHFCDLKNLFTEYEYPDKQKVIELYKYHKNNILQK